MHNLVYIIILIVLVALIAAYFMRGETTTVVVEEKLEHMAPETPEEIKTAPVPCDYPDNFYVKNNRDLLNPEAWKVPYKCGPQGCGDVLWHYMEPRMILIDNCMNCGDYKNKVNLSVPDGVESELTTSITGQLESLNPMISDELSVPQFKDGRFPQTMSGPMSNGLCNPEQGCLKDRVQSGSSCGCNGFGCETKFF